MASLEDAHGGVQLVVKLAVDALFEGHVAIGHQATLELGNGSALLAQSKAEGFASRRLPDAAGSDELLVVLDGQLQVVGRIVREDRLDRVDKAVGRGGVTVLVRVTHHAAAGEGIPDGLLFLRADNGRHREGSASYCH